MLHSPRVLALASAEPRFHFAQEALLREAQARLLGPAWQHEAAKAQQAAQIERLFAATRVHERRAAVDLLSYYKRVPGTGERMAVYATEAYTLGKAAADECLRRAAGRREPDDVTDVSVVSCTGYGAPGLDILLARDLALPRDVRRVVIGHMGCHGALVGLRQALTAVRAQPEATVLLASVELASLHFTPTLDPEVLTSYALFGDGAAAALIGAGPEGEGPELVDTYCAADFAAAGQMTWTITDQGFVMGLSPRVPATLRRSVGGVVEGLLGPHDLRAADITHWIIHPGGPAILEAVQRKLELGDEQIAGSWEVLRERGNCSSATVLLILERLLRSGRTHAGEWGVMMAFGPGLTLETCLLRF